MTENKVTVVRNDEFVEIPEEEYIRDLESSLGRKIDIEDGKYYCDGDLVGPLFQGGI